MVRYCSTRPQDGAGSNGVHQGARIDPLTLHPGVDFMEQIFRKTAWPLIGENSVRTASFNFRMAGLPKYKQAVVVE
jgi:hypothetical protein